MLGSIRESMWYGVLDSLSSSINVKTKHAKVRKKELNLNLSLKKY